MDISRILHTAVVFWIILDSLGNVPLFVTALKHFEPKKQRRIILREMLIALGVMILFLFFGEAFFKMLNIQKSSLQIAGGVILFLISIQMVFASHKKEEKRLLPKDPLIVPLAIPATTGPGVLTMISLYAGGLETSKLEVFIAIFLAWLFSLPVVLLSTLLKRLLGDNGLIALERLFGYIIVLIAMNVMLSGLFSIFHLHAP